MAEISKSFSFEASHILPNHPGKCSRLHGHSYKVEIMLEGDVLASNGFVADYQTLSDIVNPIVERLDHRHLNCFIRYPSAENIAAYFAHEMRPQLLSYRRLRVSVSETAKTLAHWDSENVFDSARLDGMIAGWDVGPQMYMHKAEPLETIIDLNGFKQPEVAIPLDAADRLAKTAQLRDIVADLYSSFESALTRLEQYRLYDQSLLLKARVNEGPEVAGKTTAEQV